MPATPTVSWVLLVAGIFAVASALVVRFPPKRPAPAALFGFAWAWLAGELPWHVLAAHIALAAFAIAFGALDALPGVIGLGLVAVFAAWPVIAHRRHCAAFAHEHSALRDAPAVPWWNRVAFFTYRSRAVRRTRHRYGPRRANVADVYRPADTTRAGPILLYVHGGGWVLGFRRWQGRILFRRLVAEGWSVVSVEYHLSPVATWPTHIIDVKRALAWVRANPAITGGDTRNIAIAGNSAGGHLATLAALTPGLAAFQPGFESADTSVVACQSWYGVYDILDRHHRWAHTGLKRLWEILVVKKSIANAPETFRLASPLEHALKPSAAPRPPFMLIHGTEDTLVPPQGADDLAAALGGAEIIRVPGAEHAFDVFWSPRAVLAVELAARWLVATVPARPVETHEGANEPLTPS